MATHGRRLLWEPRAYLSDEAVLRMSLEERGAYSTLLMAIWELEDPGVVPDDDRALAFLARATPEEWARVKPAVQRAFLVDPISGHWIQRRMVREAASQARAIKKMSLSGKRGRFQQLSGGPSGVPPGVPRDNPRTPPPGVPRSGVGVGVVEPQESEPCDASHRADAPLASSQETEPPTPLNGIVSGIARAKAIDPPKRPASPDAFPADHAWQSVQRLWRVKRLHRDAMKFAGWLWKHHTRDIAVLDAVLERCAHHDPENPFAYFSANGDAFGVTRMQTNADAAFAEHDALKATLAAERRVQP